MQHRLWQSLGNQVRTSDFGFHLGSLIPAADNEIPNSWGYNSAYDSAVMTVVNEAEQYDAWFGWNSVSTTTVFPDVGPNPVYALGTFS